MSNELGSKEGPDQKPAYRESKVPAPWESSVIWAASGPRAAAAADFKRHCGSDFSLAGGIRRPGPATGSHDGTPAAGGHWQLATRTSRRRGPGPAPHRQQGRARAPGLSDSPVGARGAVRAASAPLATCPLSDTGGLGPDSEPPWSVSRAAAAAVRTCAGGTLSPARTGSLARRRRGIKVRLNCDSRARAGSSPPDALPAARAAAT
jgi:hypothetical protein